MGLFSKKSQEEFRRIQPTEQEVQVGNQEIQEAVAEDVVKEEVVKEEKVIETRPVVVAQLPQQSVKTATQEDGTKLEIVTIEEALTEILRAVRAG